MENCLNSAKKINWIEVDQERIKKSRTIKSLLLKVELKFKKIIGKLKSNHFQFEQLNITSKRGKSQNFRITEKLKSH